MNSPKMVPMVRAPGALGKLAAEALYEYALRALARRSHTSAELKAKLARRCAHDQDVVDVMERLRVHGYLDDERLAESYSAFRRDYALLGHKRVLGELRRRGVDRATAERAVADAYGESDQSELARKYLRRKLGTRLEGTKIDDRKHLARLYRALVRAGFEPAAIADAFRSVSADSELLDSLAEASVTGFTDD